MSEAASRRPVGRPPLATEVRRGERIAVRLPRDIAQALRADALAKGHTLTSVVETLLRQGLIRASA